jgi:Patatin-like phospholipase
MGWSALRGAVRLSSRGPTEMRVAKPILSLIALVGALGLSACASTESLTDRVPEALVSQVRVDGYSRIRFYADDTVSLNAAAAQRIAEAKRFYGATLKGRAIELNYLSLSGGGEDGAYGAGFLNGWTASGTRPQFQVVTGISTGSLIAPFAFLGPEYDDVLKRAYTTTGTSDIADEHAFSAALGFAPSVSGNDRFKALISSYLTPEVFAAIGREYRKGRMLLIGTTNIDSQGAVIWDMGAIAVSGRPDALDLARTIIMASASIPGVFPPVQIKVNADSKDYDEFHVDGGVTREVFLFPPGYDPKVVDRALGWRPTRRAYVIRDGHVGPEYHATNDAMIPISARSISTLIKSQGVGDLYRIALVCARDNVDFNLAYIPTDFKDT